ncbi:MAG: hypothetical protein GDA67_15065 [Nitrospira sp. CR1.3]|nr:hypothetical protein [Nitrospira sp. CR1.3]
MDKKVRVYDDLQQSLDNALAYENGEHVDLRVTKIPSKPRKLGPTEIRGIRHRLHASQIRFASYLNVSCNAVQSWEQGIRKPQNAALKLLSIAKKNPRVLL